MDKLILNNNFDIIEDNSIIENYIISTNTIEINSNLIMSQDIKEAQYIIELAISALHIVKNIVKEVKTLTIEKENLESEKIATSTTLLDDDIKITETKLNQLKTELLSLVETFKYNDTPIFKSTSWIWTIGKDTYNWGFDLKNNIDKIVI